MIGRKKLFVCSILAILPACKTESAPAPAPSTTSAPASPAPSSAPAAGTAPATSTAPAPAAGTAPVAAAPGSTATAPATGTTATGTTATGTNVAAPAVAFAEPTGPVIEAGCTYTAGQLKGDDGTTFRVSCPAHCEQGGIYGTGVYTSDTSICRAGIHAGAIPKEGGTLTVALQPGRPAYRGSEQNGIKSRDYGKYSRSFAVVTGAAATAQAAGAAAPAAPAAGSPATATAPTATAGSSVIEAGCSYDARQLQGADGTSFRVACPAGCEVPSTTYGTGVYTADSPICKSAIHAGAIPASGGVATIKLEPGRPAYRGSDQNGIKSRDYGKYSRSYAVVTQ